MKTETKEAEKRIRKEKDLNIRVDDSIKKTIKERASRDGVTMSDYVRNLIQKDQANY